MLLNRVALVAKLFVVRRSRLSSVVVVKSPLKLTNEEMKLLERPIPKFIFGECLQGGKGEEVAQMDGVSGQTLTFAQIHQRSYSVAASLKIIVAAKHGKSIDNSTCIAIMSPNHIDFTVAMTAVALTGAFSSTLNPMYTEEEALYQLELTGSKAIITHPFCLAKAQTLSNKLGGIPVVCFGVDAAAAGSSIPFDDLANEDPSIDHDSFLPPNSFSSQSLFTVPFSSGTTGKPKGVMLTHQNIVANILQSIPYESGYSKKGYVLPNGTVVEERGTVLVPLPAFHIFGLTGLMGNIYIGSKLIFMPAFDFATFLQLIQTHKAQRCAVVPPVVMALTKHPMVDNYDLSSLKCLLVGAAPLGAAVQVACAARLKCIVKMAWGMTETSPAGLITPDHLATSAADIAGRAGILVSSTEAKIVDPATGADLPSTEEGELLVRGPQVMLGYYKNPEATAESLRADGWLHTGDIARFDSEGWAYITDRKKELIKYKGFQVAPAELEAVITAMETVKDCVVIPVEDENAGEVPRAYVVRQDDACGQALTEADVVEYVHQRVAPHKRLRGGVRFVTSVPKSPSGKLLRRVQIEMDRQSSSV